MATILHICGAEETLLSVMQLFWLSDACTDSQLCFGWRYWMKPEDENPSSGWHTGLFHLSAMNVLILLLDMLPYKNIPTEEMWKQDYKSAQLFSGGVFKCPVWASLGEWSSCSVLSAVQQGLERDGEEGLEWSFHLNFPDPLGIWMPGAREKLLSEQKHCKHEC